MRLAEQQIKNKQALSEIQMLTNLNHKNIVKYYDSCLDKNEIYIYMEYMNQGSIRQLIDRFGPFKNNDVLSNYTRQILEGIN